MRSFNEYDDDDHYSYKHEHNHELIHLICHISQV